MPAFVLYTFKVFLVYSGISAVFFFYQKLFSLDPFSRKLKAFIYPAKESKIFWNFVGGTKKDERACLGIIFVLLTLYLSEFRVPSRTLLGSYECLFIPQTLKRLR